jgi:polysaccharide transporter, PST family
VVTTGAARSRIVDNLSSLYAVQAVNYAAPLILIPYLTRVLGPAGWGDFAFAEGYARSAMLILEYGFQLAGAREIAKHQTDVRRQSSILARTMAAQAMLLVAVGGVTAGLIVLAPAFGRRGELIAASLLWAFGQAMLPLWYFQGRERIRPAAAMDAISKIAAVVAIVAVVRGPGDGARVFVVQGIAAGAASLAAFAMIFRTVPWSRPTWRGGWEALAATRTLFVYRSAVSLFTTANVVILGLLASSVTVGQFAAAEKLYRAATGLFHPFNQALYPAVSRLLESDARGAAKVVRKSAVLMVGAGGLMGAVLWIGAGWWMSVVFGAGFEAGAGAMRVLALALPVTAAVNVVGLQWLLPHRLDGPVTGVIAAAGGLNIALALVLVPGWGAMGMAWAVFGSVALVAAGYGAVLWGKKLNPFRRRAAEA